MIDIIKLERDRLKWSISTLEDLTPLLALQKLKEEIGEAESELRFLYFFPEDDKSIARLKEEYADCLMCLFDSAGRAGISITDLFESFGKKHQENKCREWHKNQDGTYSHNQTAPTDSGDR